MDRAARAERYRVKAEQIRMIADTMQNIETKELLIGAAADYLRLAELLLRTTLPDPIPASD